jgi:integrase/recombinase XerD
MKRTVSLPFLEWPSEDQALWSSLTTPGDLLGDAGGLAHQRATSLAGLVKFYGRWLEWLVNADPAALDLPPAERATPMRLAGWIASLGHVAAPTRSTLVNGVLTVVKAARPGADWRLQTLQAKALQRAARKAESYRKVGRILSSPILLQAGRKLAEQDATVASTPLKARLMQRDGTMITFLAVLPIRLRAFSELELGTSVVVSHSSISIVLTPDMTKNGRPWETPVPDGLDPVLRHYITEVRPWLIARSSAPHPRLWVGRLGKPLAYRTIINTIPAVTGRLLGVKVSPHLFRDAATTTLTRLSPDDTRLIRPMLAHSSDAIAERHYNHAKSIEAGRDHARLIERLTQERP